MLSSQVLQYMASFLNIPQQNRYHLKYWIIWCCFRLDFSKIVTLVNIVCETKVKGNSQWKTDAVKENYLDGDESQTFSN